MQGRCWDQSDGKQHALPPGVSAARLCLASFLNATITHLYTVLLCPLLRTLPRTPSTPQYPEHPRNPKFKIITQKIQDSQEPIKHSPIQQQVDSNQKPFPPSTGLGAFHWNDPRDVHGVSILCSQSLSEAHT